MQSIGKTDFILNSLTDPLLSIDKGGNIRFANKEATKIDATSILCIDQQKNTSLIELIGSLNESQEKDLQLEALEILIIDFRDLYYSLLVSYQEDEDVYLCYFKNITKEVELKNQLSRNQFIIEEHIEELTSANDVLKKQNLLVEEAQSSARASLRYGKLIQERINTNEKELKDLFPDSFQMYKPQDLIGGDLIWAKECKLGKMIGVIDCMGHGVPGAMLAMSVFNFFNEASSKGKYESVTEFLCDVVKIYHKSFFEYSDDSSFGDTFDVSLCVIDEKSNLIRFRGIKRPILIVRDGEVIEYKGSRISVSDKNAYQKLKAEPWDMVWPYKKGDKLYLFSDGYSDQFGGLLNKKFKYSNFKKFVRSISKQPMSFQKKSLELELNNWRKAVKPAPEQTDDITIVGIQL